MDKIYLKDGFLTKMIEAVPGGGFITAPFHAYAGNTAHATKACISGFGTMAATVVAGPVGAVAAGVGTAGFSSVMDHFGPK